MNGFLNTIPKIYCVFVSVLKVGCNFACIPLCGLLFHDHYKILGNHGTVNLSVSRSQRRPYFLDVGGHVGHVFVEKYYFKGRPLALILCHILVLPQSFTLI